MSKVSPEPTDDIETSSTASLQEKPQSRQHQGMETNGVTTTSFSAVEHPNYAYVSSNGQQENNESNDVTRKTFSGFPMGQSIRSTTMDDRYEPVDFTEFSFHQIARDGNHLQMKSAISQIQNPTIIQKKLRQKDKDKSTPLHYAARYNHYEMCQLLLQNGANLHARGEDNMTPLHLVAKYKPKKEKLYGAGDGDRSDVSSEDDHVEQQKKNIEVLHFLLEKGARVNEKDFYGLTPLHHACLRGNDACVEKLLKCGGISIEAVDKQLMTPLHLCSIYGNKNVARMLIDQGANIRSKDLDDGTPLQFAAAEGNLEIVELMLNKTKKQSIGDFVELLHEADSDGNTPLHLAVDNGHLNVTNYIIEEMKNISLQDVGANFIRHDNETPLHIAAKHGHLDIVKLLLQNGAKVNARDETLQSPLFLAARYNHHLVVEELIKCNANIELHDTDSYTALLIAASYGHTETMDVLLQHKANVLAVDKNDKTIVYICSEENRVNALQTLLKKKKIKSLLEVTDRYDYTPLHVAALNGHFAVVKILLSNGAIPDPKNEDEQTPLHLAADKGWVKIVRELVTQKRDIIHDDDEDGNTALHLAALSGRTHCIRELVLRGANIGARNTKQWTPLDCCAYAGMHKSALVLLEADAPVDAKDKRKQTPLHLACVHGHQKVVELLLEWGADVSHRSVSGRNALDFAIEFGRVDCARTIIDSEKWREALQNRTKDYKTELPIDTPMRKLIRKMPDVAIDVFRKCLQDNEKNKDDKNYEISFDYEFLDDEFSCTGWRDDVNTGAIPMGDSADEHIRPPSAIATEVYDHEGKVSPDAQAYSSDSNILIKNHPLMVMVRSQRVSLLRHPLVVSLLNHKWRAYGRVVYYTNLLLYVFFTIILNLYALTIPPPYAVDFNSTAVCSGANILSDAQRVWGACYERTTWQTVASYIVIVLAGLSMIKEFYQILSQRFNYIRSWTNFVEIGTYALSILLVIDISDLGRNTGVREAWQWNCGAAAIFLSWMGLLLFIQNFPKFGIFVLMFSDVFRTFISFFFVFALFILGFAFSFHVLLQNQFAFTFWWNSIVKTFVMMIGEFEFTSIFNEKFTSPADYTSAVFYEALTYIIFVIFIIIMSIIIMNLLVGLAVDDIKEVQNNAVLEGLAMQVRLALDIEYTLPTWLRKRFMMQRRKFAPNKFRKGAWFRRWLHSEQHLNVSAIDEALNPEKTDLQNMEEKLDRLQVKVRELRGVVFGLNDRSKQVENITQAIASHFDIQWEHSDDDQEMS